jgi:hypothetical protein
VAAGPPYGSDEAVDGAFHLVNDDATYWFSVRPESALMDRMGRIGLDDEEWAEWWGVLRALARYPAIVVDPDTDELAATSLSAAAARERYAWV